MWVDKIPPEVHPQSTRSTSSEDVPLVKFMYLVFTCLPGESYHRRLQSLSLCLCNVCRCSLIPLFVDSAQAQTSEWVTERYTVMMDGFFWINTSNWEGIFVVEKVWWIWWCTARSACSSSKRQTSWYCMVSLHAVSCLWTGLVSKVVPADKLLDEAVKTAEKIASFSKITVALCKEAVNSSERFFHSFFLFFCFLMGVCVCVWGVCLTGKFVGCLNLSLCVLCLT